MKKPAQHLIAEVPRRQAKVEITIGIDLGDVWSHYCTLNQYGEVVDRGRFRTTPKAIEKWFTRLCLQRGSRWRLERTRSGSANSFRSLGTKLSWRTFVSCGRSRTVTGRATRWMLRSWHDTPGLIRTSFGRSPTVPSQQQEALTLIRARALLVRLRTAAVNAVRGLTKSCGYRMPASATTCFAQRSLAVMPPGLAQALGPVLQQIAEITVKIKQYDRQIQQLGQIEYPETQALLKVHGVGHLTALTFVLTLGSKQRFGRSRDVGCYLGLRPRRSQSGDHDPQLGITHAGNAYLRSLLIECSNHILRPHGRDSALRQWGLHSSRHEAASRPRAKPSLP